jgi:CBS domain-containing protein
MSETIVRDIMIAIDSYSTVNDDADLEEAVKVLHKSFYRDDNGITYGHRSVLVINKAGELTGILTIQGILKAIDKELPGLGLPPGDLYSELTLRHGMLAHIPVRKAMSPVAKATVKDDDTAGQAIHKLLKSAVNILPVLSEGKVVGILRSIDFLQIVGDKLLGEKQGAILSFLTVS